MTSEADFSFIDDELPQDEFTVRSWNCLRGGKPEEGIPPIITWRDAATKSEEQMLRLPNFGRGSLNYVREVLVSRGLHFGMEFPSSTPNAEAEQGELPGVPHPLDEALALEAEVAPAIEEIVEVNYNVTDAGFGKALDSFRAFYTMSRGSGAVQFDIKVTDLAGVNGTFVAEVDVADFAKYLAASLEVAETRLTLSVRVRSAAWSEERPMLAFLVSNPRGQGQLVVQCPVLVPVSS